MSWLIVVVMSRLKIFFKNALGFTDGLNGQFLIAHWRGASMQLNRSFNSEPLKLFLFWNRSPANFIHITLRASPAGASVSRLKPPLQTSSPPLQPDGLFV
jgi:hypothetical protein